MNPMIPFLTGWLAGCVGNDAGKCMKVMGVEPTPPDGFLVKFESGLEVKVKVEAVPKMRCASDTVALGARAN
jgi:hypothetical protein